MHAAAKTHPHVKLESQWVATVRDEVETQKYTFSLGVTEEFLKLKQLRPEVKDHQM